MWIGVDVMRSGELDALLERAWFRSYVYAPQELAVAESFGETRAREFLTGRFAAKEAVLKAIGTGVSGGVRLRQVVVLRGSDGAPRVTLTGLAADRAADRGVAHVGVSITHKQDLVVAAAVGVPAACRDAHPDRPDQALLAGLRAELLNPPHDGVRSRG